MAIYTLVGENTSSSLAVIKQYNSTTDTWSTVVDVANPITDGVQTVNGLYSIHGTSDGQFMMAGGYRSPGYVPTTAISTDGGVTWTIDYSGPLASIGLSVSANNIQVVSPTEAYCVIEYKIYKWNGLVWALWFDFSFWAPWSIGRIQIISGYMYITAFQYVAGSPVLSRIPISNLSPTLLDLEQETSIDLSGTDKGLSDILIDSNGIFYASEFDYYNAFTRINVWRGTWNNFVVDYDGYEGLDDRYPINACTWGNYNQPGFGRLYVAPDHTVFWLFNNANDFSKHWIAKRDSTTDTWSSVRLVNSNNYRSSSIIGSADDSNDILSIAGESYWWNGGPGYYQKYNGTSWSLEQDSGYSITGGTTFGMFAMFAPPPPLDANGPYLQNKDPEHGDTNVSRFVNTYLEIVDDESNVSLPNTTITIESDTAYNGSAFVSPYNGPLSVVGVIEGVPSGYSFTIDRTSEYESLQVVNVNVSSEDIYGNTVTSGYSFQVEFYATDYSSLGQQVDVFLCDQYLRHQLQVSQGAEFIGTPIPGFAWNQFDEFALLAGIKRLRSEQNYSLKRRTINTFVDRANSTYRGLINGITRELGLSLYYPLTINPKRSPYTSKFYASDPYIKFDAAYLYLYSDYENSVLDYKLDRFENGGNYEHLTRLVNFINSTTYFEASINSSYDPYIRSLSIINQSNREVVTADIINSTKVKLSKEYIVRNSIIHNNTDIFKTEKNYEIEVTESGDYYIDYFKGKVTTYNHPPVGTILRYKYTVFPFKPVASDIIIYDVNNENFKVKMFKQILQDDGSYTHGLPTELGADIINELMSVSPMYYGV